MDDVRSGADAARALRERSHWPVELEPGIVVTMRRLDMVTLFMDGLVPTPLLASIFRLMKLPGADMREAVLGMTDDERKGVMTFLRAYAKAAILAPVVVDEDDGDPTHLPVSLLTSDHLLAIWQGSPAEIKGRTEVAARAEQFRGAPADGAPDALRDGAEVRPETVELVDSGDRSTVHQ